MLNHHQRLFQGYGITLASLGRFQLNALIERDTGGFGFFDDISEERVFLPFAWMEEGVEGPSEVCRRGGATKMYTHYPLVANVLWLG